MHFFRVSCRVLVMLLAAWPVFSLPGRVAGAAPRAATSVTIIDFAFQPASVTAVAGDKVTWTNAGQAAHTATAVNGSFDTGVLNSGESGSATFNSAGTFSYFCAVHPEMRGTVGVRLAPRATPITLPSTGGDPAGGAPLLLLAVLAAALLGAGGLALARGSTRP